MTTKRYVDGVKRSGWPPFRGRLWQRNYYEHIIRSERTLKAIRRYILENPHRWHLDRYNDQAVGPDPMGHDIWRMMQDDAHRVQANFPDENSHLEDGP